MWRDQQLAPTSAMERLAAWCAGPQLQRCWTRSQMLALSPASIVTWANSGEPGDGPNKNFAGLLFVIPLVVAFWQQIAISGASTTDGGVGRDGIKTTRKDC